MGRQAKSELRHDERLPHSNPPPSDHQDHGRKEHDASTTSPGGNRETGEGCRVKWSNAVEMQEMTVKGWLVVGLYILVPR